MKTFRATVYAKIEKEFEIEIDDEFFPDLEGQVDEVENIATERMENYVLERLDQECDIDHIDWDEVLEDED